MRILYALALCLSAAACGDDARTSEQDAAEDLEDTPGASEAGTARAGHGPPAGDIALKVSAAMGGQTYEVSDVGACEFAEQAAIYDVPASLWRVEYAGGRGAAVEHLNLSVWRPKGGRPDQFSLALETGSASHRIATVTGGEQVGSGKVIVQPENSGARFEIDGEAGDGTKLRVTVECPRFNEVVAEGG